MKDRGATSQGAAKSRGETTPSGGLTREQRARRVRAVLDAARRLADPHDPLGIEARRALPLATGLSAPNVELSLTQHLETSVSDADLERLVTRAGVASRVHVVLSANVFVGVVRAVALAMATAPVVIVRPSSREGVLTPLLLQALKEQGSGPIFALSTGLDAAPGDHVHVYGRRETIADIAARCPPGVTVRGHGPGFGIGVVGKPRGNTRDAAERLSWDIVPFDQRGCLSPRLAFVEGTVDEAAQFASCLAQELELREKEVPRGALSDEEQRDASLYRQTLTAVGALYAAASFAVGLDVAPRALVLPPPGRHIHLVRVNDAAHLAQLLDGYLDAITCVGVDDAGATAGRLEALLPGARILPLGKMQRPPLDGPVDLRDVV